VQPGAAPQPGAAEFRLEAPCLPDMRAEHDHLAGLLPEGMLADRGRARPARDGDPASCAVLAWARSGLMHLTGHTSGPPLAPQAPVLARAAAIAAMIAEITGANPVRLRLDHVLAFRARLNGWSRRGTISANGTCRILRAADGWVAVNLARPDDRRSVPAVLGRNPHSGVPGCAASDGSTPATMQQDSAVWDELAAEALTRPAAMLAAQAQAVGIPASALPNRDFALSAPPPPPVTATWFGPAGAARRLVLDLSAMWAGPLCASILGGAGWRVLKVEDIRRPDGARRGPPAFYAGLHAGSRTVILDFGSAQGRAELTRLAGLAGIVVESSRPRALRQLGLVAEDWLSASPGRVWVSVTGYGRQDPQQRVAFGDDAAVAGGLTVCDGEGTPLFCGDAIADPLSGLYAALSALAAHAAGGGWLMDVAMAGVCADLARPAAAPAWPHIVSPQRSAGARRAGWTVRHGDLNEPVRSW
jgi:crotonobetainyl-CoA:carnitine CoA-transferase CaiB-like acyl-CoA transferase